MAPATKIGSLASSNPQANPQGCGFRKCKPRSAGEGRSVTLKNLVRSEVRSGVRVRKKCLNHPTAAERGCCQFTEKVTKIANEKLVRGEVQVKYAARTRTNGLRTSPPDCGGSGGVEAHRLLAGLDGGSKPTGKPTAPCGFRKRKYRQTISRMPGLQRDITHYKRRFTLLYMQHVREGILHA